jgi:hypothetical protein
MHRRPPARSMPPPPIGGLKILSGLVDLVHEIGSKM